MPQNNRVPGGLLDLLLAETGGKTPPRYAEDLAVVADAFWLYAQETLSAFNTTLQHTTRADTLEITVPAEESWILRAVSVFTSLPLNTDFEQWEFRIRQFPRAIPEGSDSAPFPQIFVSDLLQVQTGGQVASAALHLPQPLVLSPGVEVQVVLAQRDASAVRTSRIQLLINRLRRGAIS